MTDFNEIWYTMRLASQITYANKILRIQQSKMAGGRHLEKSTRNQLTDFDEIWYANASQPSAPQ